MSSRWDRLLDVKPVALIDHLLDEVARLLVKDLGTWPLPVREVDAITGQGVDAMLQPGASRPADPVFVEAFRLARWDLAREVDAFDDYMRNQRWLERGLSRDDRPVLLFICRWLVEQLLALGESTEGRVSRSRMLDCLERTQRKLGLC